MNRILRITSGFLLLLLFLNGCKKDMSFYARPANLSPAIYQQLQAKGNFTSLLACIDRAGYKTILSTAGYWTLFAPNDSAFIKYFKDKSISGVKDIDSATCRKIVTYSLVYNSQRKDQLSNYQPTTGLVANQAFKRKTVYYDFVTTEAGTNRKIVGANRNGSYVAGDNNNKSIPYFIDNVMGASALTAADYNDFFPNTTYTGFNVIDAKVVHADIDAENGMIHEIDKVLLPLQNIEQYMASNSNYDVFRGLLAKMVTYVSNGDLTHRYNVLSGSTDSVFVKLYTAGLAFSPNNENFLLGNTDYQIGGYTLMCPTNDAVNTYLKKILMYYKTFDAAPPSVLLDFLNSHMWSNLVWKSKFSRAPNFQNNEIPTITTANIVDKHFLSNGIFYGTNQAQDANCFRTVYSKVYLNPAFALMNRALDAELKFSLVNPSINYTMFMMSTPAIIAGYYNWDANHAAWSYSPPGVTVDYSQSARDNFYRILQTSVSAPNVNYVNLTGSGILEMYNGEYVKFSNNQIQSSGNVAAGNYLQIDSVQTTVNGKVYYSHEVVPTGKQSTGGLLTYTSQSIGTFLTNLNTADATNFGSFFTILKNCGLWNADDAANPFIVGMSSGNFYTIFIPTNLAITNAIKAGTLPGNIATGAFPTWSSMSDADKTQYKNFVQYHILNKNCVAPDGRKTDAYATLLVDSGGNPTFINITTNSVDLATGAGTMILKDAYGTTANVVISKSNNISNRCLIHSIDHVLNYIY